MRQHEVVVAGVTELTPLVRELRLVAADGHPLPAHAPGDHIEVEVAIGSETAELRPYFLVDRPDDPETTYRIAVERKPEGRGGSRFLHGIATGARLAISDPRREFALDPYPAYRLLVAEEVGIVPLLGMVRLLAGQNGAFALHCVATEPEKLPYRQDIERIAGPAAQFHYHHGDPQWRLAIDPLIAAMPYPSEVYVCGRRALTERVSACAFDHGLSRLQVHEHALDPEPAVENTDTGFELELRQSGLSVYVPADSSILETLLSAGHPVKFYCGRGECGTCPLPVLEADGVIEHRDHFLDEDEKSSNARLCICVSRLHGARLVLDA